jgi:subtilisin family serine protease
MNYIVKGRKYIFALLVLIILSACGTKSPPQPSSFNPTQLATVSIAVNDTKANLENLYGGKVLMFQPKSGFAVLGFDDAPKLSTLSTEPNADVASPEVSALGGNAWGGGSNSWASGVNSWGTGANAWGGGANAWGGGVNAWGGGTNAWGTGTNAWGSGSNAWGSGQTTIPALPGENRYLFQSIRLPQAHTVSRNFGAGVKVAVIDTGIDFNHPLFGGRLAPANEWKDFIDGDSIPQEVSGSFYGHGTGIAGLIVQVAPRATILPIRVLGPDGMGDVANIVMAIDWAVQKGADVINLSLGTDQDIASLKQAVTYAAQMGVYVVAAAGNEGSNQLLYPAKYMTSSSYNDLMFSVGSYGSALLLSLFCNSGPELEFVAPGELMLSAYPDMRVARYTGSSFATPIVAGSVALAQSEAPGEYKWWIDWYLEQSSVSLGSNLGRKIDVNQLLQQIPGFVKRSALFVHGGASPSTSDASLISRTRGLGYNVTTIESKKALSTSATGHDLVIISATANAGDTNTKFRNIGVPVLIWRSDLFDDMALTTNASGQFGSTDKLTRIKVLQSTHPLASGYSSLLNPTVYNASEWQSWGVTGTGAVKVASLEADITKSVIFAYDTGSQMISMIAPARRVGFFLRDNQASKLTEAGWQLFESAITWATSGN